MIVFHSERRETISPTIDIRYIPKAIERKVRKPKRWNARRTPMHRRSWENLSLLFNIDSRVPMRDREIYSKSIHIPSAIRIARSHENYRKIIHARKLFPVYFNNKMRYTRSWFHRFRHHIKRI